MTELARFHHVALTVTDLDRSAAFYGDVLGFVELFREEADERRVIVFGFPSGGHAVGLVWHAGEGERFDPTVTGLDHVAFGVDRREDLDAWLRRLEDADVPTSGVIDVPPGAILNLKDPDGIALSLFWDR